MSKRSAQCPQTELYLFMKWLPSISEPYRPVSRVTAIIRRADLNNNTKRYKIHYSPAQQIKVFSKIHLEINLWMNAYLQALLSP